MSFKTIQICEQLGLRIRSARKTRNLTSKEVARKTGISQRTYRRVEAGEESVGLGQYIKACNFFDLNFLESLDKIEQLKKVRVKKKIVIHDQDVNF